MKRLKMLIGGVAAVLSSGWATAGTPDEHLAVWLTADSGVETNASGVVTQWTNRGTLGSVYDVAPLTPSKNAIKVITDDAVFGARPVVHFDSTDPLVSAGSSADLFSSSGLTCFIVYQAESGYNRTLWCASPNNATARVGAWFTEGTLVCALYGTTENKVTSVPVANQKVAHCFCDTTYVVDNVRTERAFVYSVPQGNVQGSRPAIVPAASKLWIGDFQEWGKASGWTYFMGSIAEFRIYNRGLTATERAAIDFELSSKYGLQTKAFGLFMAILPGGYTHDVVGAGHALDGGTPAATVMTATSGGADFAFVTAPAADTNALVVFAHDGGEGLERRWWLGGDEGARACPATLSFDAAGVPAGKRRIFCRPQGGTWRPLDVIPTESEGRLVFALPAGWAMGEYGIGDPLAPNLAIWLRADQGLETNELGQVVKWANQGTFGSVFDVEPASGAPNDGVTVEAADSRFNGHDSVYFNNPSTNRQDSLISKSPSNAGLATDGGTWFVVCNTDTSLYGALFSFSESQYHRIGAWIDGNDYNWIGVFDGSSASYGGKYGAKDGDSISLSESTYVKDGGGRVERLFIKSWLGTKPVGTPWAFAPTAALLKIGNFMNWNNLFWGRIAELRLYNRPLTAPEREAVDFELAAKYQLKYKGFDSGDVPPPAAYVHDVVGAGCATDRGPAVATVMRAESGGAVFAFATAPAADTNALVVLAHDGGEGLERRWYLAGEDGACACPVTLSFDAAGVPAGKRRIFFRPQGGTWRPLDVIPTESEGRLVFALPAGWAMGEYGIGDPLAPNLAIWLCADQGLETNEWGQVVKWANQGTFGSVFDVAPLSGTPNDGIVATAKDSDFNGHASVVFDQTDSLISAESSKAGLATDGGTWFLVYNTDTGLKGSLFSFSESNDHRIGAWIDGQQWELRGVFDRSTGTYGGAYRPPMAGDSLCLCDTTYLQDGGGRAEHLFVKSWLGSTPSGAPGAFAPTAARLRIGDFMTWKDPMDGRIVEFRLYNRPLTAPEREAVDFELSAKYGLKYKGFGSGDVPPPAAYVNDVVGAGCATNRGPAVATVMGAESGGAVFAFATAPTADSNALVVMAHDGGEGLARRWYLAGEDGARACPVTLAFDVGDDPAAVDSPVLRYQASPNGDWKTLTRDCRIVDGRIVFALPAGWSIGAYACESRPYKGLSIIVR